MTRRREVLEAVAATAGVGTAGCSYSGPTDTGVYSFGNDVSAEWREAVLRVDRRLDQVLGRRPRQPTRIETVDSAGNTESGTQLSSLLFEAQHVSPNAVTDSDAWGPSGRYIDDGERNRVLLYLDHVDESVVAHELCHAVQAETAGTVTPADSTRDARQAAASISEGMAEYVQWLYDWRCRNGDFESCRLPDRPSISELTAVALAAGIQPYLAGMRFAHAAFERGGWPNVWDAYRNPPRSTVEVLYPDRYFDREIELATPSVPDPSHDDWVAFGRMRLGVFPLYTKLYALGLVSLDDPKARASASLTWRTGWRRQIGSRLLDRWRGDRFVGYGDITDGESSAYAWRTAWDDEDAAATVASAVSGAYDDRGTPIGDVWRLNGTVVGIARQGTTVEFRMAPDDRAYGTLF